MCRKGQDKYDRTGLTVLDRLKGLDHTGQDWTVLNRHTGMDRTGQTYRTRLDQTYRTVMDRQKRHTGLDWTRHIGPFWTDRKDIQDHTGHTYRTGLDQTYGRTYRQAYKMYKYIIKIVWIEHISATHASKNNLKMNNK